MQIASSLVVRARCTTLTPEQSVNIGNNIYPRSAMRCPNRQFASDPYVPSPSRREDDRAGTRPLVRPRAAGARAPRALALHAWSYNLHNGVPVYTIIPVLFEW